MSTQQNIQDIGRITVTYDAANTAWHAVHELLESARRAGKEVPVARCLVEANLALRFPELPVRDDSASGQDVDTGGPDGLFLNDTAFHVTVIPAPGYLEKCAANVAAGLGVYLLVPDRILQEARQNAELALPGRITTQSIESFVSQTIEAQAAFSKGAVVSGFQRLLDMYNERVGATEPDKSLLLKIAPAVENQVVESAANRGIRTEQQG